MATVSERRRLSFPCLGHLLLGYLSLWGMFSKAFPPSPISFLMSQCANTDHPHSHPTVKAWSLNLPKRLQDSRASPSLGHILLARISYWLAKKTGRVDFGRAEVDGRWVSCDTPQPAWAKPGWVVHECTCGSPETEDTFTNRTRAQTQNETTWRDQQHLSIQHMREGRKLRTHLKERFFTLLTNVNAIPL